MCFTNVQTVYLLKNPNFFNVSNDRIGRVTSNLMFVATLTALIGVMVAGYLYDLFSRKALITIYFFFLAGLLFLLPRTAPNVPFLVCVRALIQLFGSICLSHPLIMDYVKKESRGKAIALASLGVMSGEVFGMAVLFGYSKQMEANQAFFITSIVIFVMAIPFVYIVTDLEIKQKKVIVNTEGLDQPLLNQNQVAGSNVDATQIPGL